MNDPLIDDPQPNAPAQPAAQPPQNDQRMDRLENAMTQLTATVASAAQRLTAPAVSQQPAPQTADQFLNELATNPQDVIGRVARDALRQEAATSINPAMLQVFDTTGKQILNSHQLKIDNEFGVGTFDELFRPQLDKDLAELRATNPRALADPALMEALVNRLYGGSNFQSLSDKRANIEKAHQRGLTHLVPGGGAPRLRQLTGDELPADVEQFLRETDRASGTNTDRKQFAKLYYTGEESGPGRHRTGVLDYLRATGADASTLKEYGG